MLSTKTPPNHEIPLVSDGQASAIVRLEREGIYVKTGCLSEQPEWVLLDDVLRQCRDVYAATERIEKIEKRFRAAQKEMSRE